MNVLIGFAVPEFVYQGLRLLAASVGAIGGWIVAGPLAGGLVRLIFRRPLGDNGKLVARFLGGGAIAALIYFYLPLGPGGGGEGTGGGIGDGTGSGITGNTNTGKPGKDSPSNGQNVDKKAGKPQTKGDVLRVEILGKDRYKGGGKYYLLDGEMMDYDQLDALLERRKGVV